MSEFKRDEGDEDDYDTHVDEQSIAEGRFWRVI
jgi:hypothetical protein